MEFKIHILGFYAVNGFLFNLLRPITLYKEREWNTTDVLDTTLCNLLRPITLYKEREWNNTAVLDTTLCNKVCQ
jgi:hypothetical protein